MTVKESHSVLSSDTFIPRKLVYILLAYPLILVYIYNYRLVKHLIQYFNSIASHHLYGQATFFCFYLYFHL